MARQIKRELRARAVFGVAVIARKGEPVAGLCARNIYSAAVASIARPKCLAAAMRQHLEQARFVAVRVGRAGADTMVLTARALTVHWTVGCILGLPFGFPCSVATEMNVSYKDAHVLQMKNANESLGLPTTWR